MNTRPISLSEAIQRVAIPAATVFQRRAEEWRAVHQECAIVAGIYRDEYVFPDPLEFLRNELNTANGSALSNLALLAKFAKELSGVRIVLPDNQAGWELSDTLMSIHRNSGTSQFERKWFVLRGATRLKSLISRGKRSVANVFRRFRQNGQAINCSHFDLLFLPRTPTHLADWVPVLDVMKREMGIQTLVAAIDVGMFRAIGRLGLPSISIAPLARSRKSIVRTQINNYADRLVDCLHGQSAYAPISNLEHSILIRTTRNVIMKYGVYAVQVGVAIKSLLKTVGARGLLIGNPYTMEGRTAGLFAHAMGLPRFALEHGSIFPDKPNWLGVPVDLVCVWGQASHNSLVQFGIPHKSLAITGAPRYDRAFNSHAAKERSSVKRRRVLVATSGPGDSVSHAAFQGFIKTLYEAIRQAPHIEWIIRLHPKDRERFYSDVFRPTPSNVAFLSSSSRQPKLDIFEQLDGVDALITICSTSALDAMVMGVPVIAVDVWPSDQGLRNVEFLEYGVSSHVKSSAELAKAVELACQEPSNLTTRDSMQHYLHYLRHHFENQGSASTHVAAAIASRLHE